MGGSDTVVLASHLDDIDPQVLLSHCSVSPILVNHEASEWERLPAFILRPGACLAVHRDLVDADGRAFIQTRSDVRSGATIVDSAELGPHERLIAARDGGLLVWSEPDTSSLYSAVSRLPGAVAFRFDGFVLPDEERDLHQLPPQTRASPAQVQAVHDRFQNERLSASGLTTITTQHVTDEVVLLLGATSGYEWLLRATRSSSSSWLVESVWGDPEPARSYPGTPTGDLTINGFVAAVSGGLDVAVIGFAPGDVDRVELVDDLGISVAHESPRDLGLGFKWFVVAIRVSNAGLIRFIHKDGAITERAIPKQ